MKLVAHSRNECIWESDSQMYLMELREVSSALSDDTRLRLLETVRDEGPLTSKSAHELFVDRYTDRRRESIYKALEALVDAELLEKYYDRDGDGIVYRLRHKLLLIDLNDMTVSEAENK